MRGALSILHQSGRGWEGDSAEKRSWTLEVAGRKGAHLQLLALVRNGQVQHTAIYCNILQHIATRCNTQ